MNLSKIEELGNIATTSSANACNGVVGWNMEISRNAAGSVSFFANGTLVATGSGFTATAMTNVSRVGFGIETLASATTITDLAVVKAEHTIL